VGGCVPYPMPLGTRSNAFDYSNNITMFADFRHKFKMQKNLNSYIRYIYLY